MLDQVETTAAQDGLKYHLRGSLYGDTSVGHRLVLWGTKKGFQGKILERCRAYFAESISIFEQKIS